MRRLRRKVTGVSRTRIVSCVGLLLWLSIGASLAASSADEPNVPGSGAPEEPSEPWHPALGEGIEESPERFESDSLGNYGRSGPIFRDQLPPGIREYVTDRAIELAESEQFASAREAWDAEIDFVGQVDYQLRYRAETDYLSTEPGHIADLLLAKPMQNAGWTKLGLFLSDAEAAEHERRHDLNDRSSQVVEVATGMSEDGAIDPSLPEGSPVDYGPNFGGIWQDHLDGGALVVVLVDASKVDRDALATAAGGADNLRIIELPYSERDIRAFATTLREELASLGVESDIAVLPVRRVDRIQVRVEELDDLNGFESSVPDDAFEVVETGQSKPTGLPQALHSWADVQPGLAVAVISPVQATACGWAFNGHTSGNNYIISAGHCAEGYDNFASTGTSIGIGHPFTVPSPRDLTPGTQFFRSVHNVNYDVLRESSPNADSNCYHQSGTHCLRIRARAEHNSWEIGDDICASLSKSNQYRCGFILEENVQGSRQTRTTIDVVEGDSGSGFMWDGYADGVQSSGDALSNGVFLESLFTSAADTTTQLAVGTTGFSLNCANTAIHQAASLWGVCPIFNR
jgi:hypothetical protein